MRSMKARSCVTSRMVISCSRIVRLIHSMNCTQHGAACGGVASSAALGCGLKLPAGHVARVPALGAHLNVHVVGGLVKDEDVRGAEKRGRDSYLAPLAARHLVDGHVAIGDAHLLQRLLRQRL